jgi:hypothetical protein
MLLFWGRFFIPSAEMAGNSDLPPKKGSIIKLENFLLWIKGDNNERTKTYGRRDHQQVAGSERSCRPRGCQLRK